jgi:hypothetical protein
MKKYIFLILFYPLMDTLIFGQAFTGGLAGGFSINQIDGDEYRGYNMLGTTDGAYVQTKMQGNWQGQLEIKYYLKGAHQSPTNDNPNNYTIHLNYIEVPVLVDYYITNKIFPEAGFGAGYLFRAREDRSGVGFIAPEKAFNPLEFSFQAGINYQFTKQVRGNVRFSYSLIPIRNNPGNATYYLNQGEYNNSMSLSIYYRIR